MAHSKQQLFSPLQEDMIAEWILESEKEGTPRTGKDMVEFAELILCKDKESPVNVSRSWFRGFKKKDIWKFIQWIKSWYRV